MKPGILLIIIALMTIFSYCGKKDSSPTDSTQSDEMVVPKLGQWSTGVVSIGANATLTISFPVSLEDGKYDLYYGSYTYHIGAQIIGGTWGDITETDTFSTSADFQGDHLSIEGQFLSSTEAEGTISYTGLPTVEWTATWQSE